MTMNSTAPSPEGVEPPPGASAEGPTLRIGEVAKQIGVTTRTLRYWEEVGLFSPHEHRDSGERLYSPADAAQARRIRELQVLLGFSLSEIRAVMAVEDILDKLRSARSSNPRLARKLLDEAIEANDDLVGRLDQTLARVRAFRDEQAGVAERLRAAVVRMESEQES
jgi:MerR family transcriptional regulator, repressor of the yfmOP operon